MLLTQALFWETRKSENLDVAEFTTKNYNREIDGRSYQSLYQLYMQIADPTEYEFVEQAFNGNWKQWEAIQKSTALKKVGLNTDTWEHRLDVKLVSGGVLAMVADGQDSTSSSRIPSARWVAEGKYKFTKKKMTAAEKKEAKAKVKEIQGEIITAAERERKAAQKSTQDT
jgi:hypothetical protein